MIDSACPTEVASCSRAHRFRIAEALGPGEHEVRVVAPGPPVRLRIYGTDYDERDRPCGVVEALHPDLDGIGWGDVWEAVRRQRPEKCLPAKDMTGTPSVLLPAVKDEAGLVITGSLPKRAKGSPMVPVRIPAELLELMDKIIARSTHTRRDGPWTRSSFIVAAIEEKIEKMARSAGKAQSPLPKSYKRDSSTF